MSKLNAQVLVSKYVFPGFTGESENESWKEYMSLELYVSENKEFFKRMMRI